LGQLVKSRSVLKKPRERILYKPAPVQLRINQKARRKKGGDLSGTSSLRGGTTSFEMKTRGKN